MIKIYKISVLETKNKVKKSKRRLNIQYFIKLKIENDTNPHNNNWILDIVRQDVKRLAHTDTTC